MANPVISYTSPLMNRYEQLCSTFDDNLTSISHFNGRVEWIIVNLKRTNIDITEWQKSDSLIRTKGAELITRGWLKYVTGELKYYHHSVCKNIASNCARGRFIINLDIDNHISIIDTTKLLEYDLDNIIYHGFDGNWNGGTCGMIGMPKHIYKSLGGYNEQFLPYGYDDIDMLSRAIIYSGFPVHCFCTRIVIQNSDSLRCENFEINKPIREQNEYNRNISNANISAGKIICYPHISNTVCLFDSDGIQISNV